MRAISKTAALAAFFTFGTSLTAQAGGFQCELTRECVNHACSEVDYTPYIDTDWGKIVVKNFGPEIEMDLIPDNQGKFTLYANLPNGGLYLIIVNQEQDDSAMFSTFGNQGGSVRVINIYGKCGSVG